jgi:predicted ATP-grasp superfamily ATP-dependent carboligase
MIRQYPPYIGVTSLGVCVTNEAVKKQTKTFMKAIGYRGPLDIGYKYDDRTGQYKAIDVNPRIGTTFRLLVDTLGMDVARALYLD